MIKRIVHHMLLLVFMMSCFIISSQEYASTTKYKKVVRVITTYNKGKAIPVYKFNPRKEITRGLQKAGFKVVSEKSKNYSLTLKITYRERARQISRYPGDNSPPKILIDHIGFVLEDKAGTILLKEERGPFGTYASMENVKQSFVKDLIELVKIRIKKGDETSCWLEFVSRRGDEAGTNAIQKAGDSTYSERKDQIIALKPFLRSHEISKRVITLRLLKTLEYVPISNTEKAAFFIVQTYPFHRWSAQVGEMDPGAWAARQGSISVMKYDTTAIGLLIEDLKGRQNLNSLLYGVESGGVAARANSILLRLSKERWAKFGYTKSASIGRQVKYVDKKPNSDFFKVEYFSIWGKQQSLGKVEVVNPKRAPEVYSKVWNQEWNDYAIKKLIDVLKKGKNVSNVESYLIKEGIDNRNYFKNVIDILGKIADNRAIAALNNYLTHSIFADNAKKALKEIENRINNNP